jgi:hypothetical protein
MCVERCAKTALDRIFQDVGTVALNLAEHCDRTRRFLFAWQKGIHHPELRPEDIQQAFGEADEKLELFDPSGLSLDVQESLDPQGSELASAKLEPVLLEALCQLQSLQQELYDARQAIEALPGVKRLYLPR